MRRKLHDIFLEITRIRIERVIEIVQVIPNSKLLIKARDVVAPRAAVQYPAALTLF
jgi:hypothetical protein